MGGVASLLRTSMALHTSLPEAAPLLRILTLAFGPWLSILLICAHKHTGPPKQFAAFVGINFSVMVVALHFTHNWIPCTVIAAILCFFAALEAFLNFCAGCLVFQFMIK